MVSTIKQIAPNVRVINYVTDGGPSPSHFKNQYNILTLSFHDIDFGVRAIWTFAATLHSKGPMDGLGAPVKSTTTRYLMPHGPEEAFKSAKQFYKFSKKRHRSSQSPIQLLYTESEEVVHLHEQRNMKRWEKTKSKSSYIYYVSILFCFQCSMESAHFIISCQSVFEQLNAVVLQHPAQVKSTTYNSPLVQCFYFFIPFQIYLKRSSYSFS